MNMRTIQILLLSLFLLPCLSTAQDTLHVGTQLKTEKLNVGSSKSYIHYRLMKDGSKIPFSINRITLESKGASLVISQQNNSGEQSWKLETVVNARTLVTDTHVRESPEKRESYQFGKEAVTGIADDTKADNSDFRIDLSEPTFNFEIDFIFLQSINWSDHESVVMNFYHPGGSLPPAYYEFVRDGEERLSLANGITVDTWIIMTDYNGQPPARFWITKDTNEIIKQETDLMERAGFTFVKQLM